MLKSVFTTEAPAPRPQLSQAIKCNGMLYCSGAIGVDPKTKKMVEGTVADRMRQTFRNLSAVLEAGGSSLEHVVKVNIYLTNMEDFPTVNDVYDEFFVWDSRPSRTCMGVSSFPAKTDIEIDLIAAVAVGASKAKL